MGIQAIRLGGALLAGVVLAGLAGPVTSARAQTIPFNEALTWSYNPAATGINSGNTCCDYINIVNANPAAPASTTYSQSGPWGSVNGFASADLATGQLKMRAAASVGDGSAAPSMQTNAIFGDGFRAIAPGNAPFTWTPGSNAQFTLDLSGVLDASQPLTSTFNPDAFVILSILQPGTLDPNSPLVNGPTAEQYFFWNIGNPSTTIYYTDQNANSQILTPTAEYSTIPSTITANFNPNGDFDWVLLLGASGQVSGPGDYFDFDLSHTLTLSYAGPQGSTTDSTSGQFVNFDEPLPPTVTTPEPASMALLLAGVVGLAGLRRRTGVAG